MGFERLVSVLQNKRSNYDTDVFDPYFQAIQNATRAPHPYSGKLGASDAGNVDTAYRVIADHIRTLTFAITDGATPSNEGRGYVLRRILRRAVRYGRQVLDAKTGFFSQLVPVVVQQMGEAFQELHRNPQRAIDVLREEEESFGRTLDRGIKLFEEAAQRGGETISADDAFKLYDTFGFPIDLTEQMAEERGLKVDKAGYDRLMSQAKELSKQGAKQGGDKELALDGDAVARLKHMGIEPTDDSDKFHARDVYSSIRAIWNGENFDDSTRDQANRTIGLVLDKTNFYAEMGGQQCDTGQIFPSVERRTGPDNTIAAAEFNVDSVKSFGGFVLHIGRGGRGELRVGDKVRLHVDHTRRRPIASNHTATHMLNFGLRKVLGTHVDQKGSLVAPDRLRFDFTNSGPVTPEQLRKVEAIVREQISEDLTVYSDIAPQFVAKQISGLRAVFGETYPDPVRVVSIGQPISDLLANPGNPMWNEVSVEFCGGTHLGSTKEAEDFALVSEEAVAKGIRRIVALTGVPAKAARAAAENLAVRVKAAANLDVAALPAELNDMLREVDQLTLPSVRRDEIKKLIAALQEKLKAAQKQAAAGKKQEAAAMARRLAESAQTSGESVIVSSIELGSDRGSLEQAVKTIRDMCPRAAVMLFSPDPDPAAPKIGIIASIPPDAVKKGLNAGEWLREAAAICDGKGGGKPEAAQGGGTNIGKLKDAIATARLAANKKLL
jgi:alanyl-tRNA synthetase